MASTYQYPFTNNKFQVEIDQINVASFAEVSGLGVEIEFEEFKEGGVNEFTYKLPKSVKYGNLTLKRGVTDNDDLFKWFKKAAEGNIEYHNVGIVLLNSQGEEVQRWNFKNAYPVKWSATDLNSQSNNVIIETLELAHQGLNFG